MARHVNVSGLVIAGIGFFLTRFTVSLAIYEDPVRFYLAGVVPLGLGLGLAAFGMALTVADVEASLVRTTALWCVIGAGTMLILVVLTLLGSPVDGMTDFATIRSRTYLSNFLIGGSVGGTLTGLYAARNRRHRTRLTQQANRLEVLNRLLRHEILNAATVIRGYASLDGKDEAPTTIEEYSDTIIKTVKEVGYLTRTATPDGSDDPRIGIGAVVDEAVRMVEADHPAARISTDPIPDGLRVRGDEQLTHAFKHLIENAVTYGTAGAPVTISVSATGPAVRVSVRDEGPGLPPRQRALLETGRIGEFDDPESGFGLNIVRLLVESYDGSIEADVSDSGTTITVELAKVHDGGRGSAVGGVEADPTGVRPAMPQLIVILGTAFLAAIPYGIVAEQLGGSIAAIGVFYGIQNPVVGWLTHLFHSAVFGFVFASLVSVAPARYRNRFATFVVIGFGWAVFLWIVAAGIIAPIWLQLLGIPAPIPNLSNVLLLSHLAWGLTLGILTPLGYRYVSPWVARQGARLEQWFPTD